MQILLDKTPVVSEDFFGEKRDESIRNAFIV